MKQRTTRTAIITGSGRGIGKENAILLAKSGMNVVVCSRTQSEINSVVQEIKQIHNLSNDYTDQEGVLGIKCDVTVPSEVDSLMNLTIEKYGGDNIDILVNNAGVVFNRKIIDTTEQEWDQTISTNLKSGFLFTKAVLPYMMKKNFGVIVNVNSGAGKAGFENLSAYRASKFGLIGLSESVALEVAAYNIRVLTICPGEVATKMWQDFDYSFYKQNKDKMLKPQKVAERILEMIFEAKNYENGKLVDIYNS
jgi:3-oxoacyl-[acyl-carrier protein] reductase